MQHFGEKTTPLGKQGTASKPSNSGVPNHRAVDRYRAVEQFVPDHGEHIKGLFYFGKH